MTPYYDHGGITIYHGDCREVLPAMSLRADCIIADPPYAQTSLGWDRWPDGWADAAFGALAETGSMWCFGSLKLFMRRASAFARFIPAQDIVWEKHNGSNFHADRFKRVHDQAVQFYRADSQWADVYKNPQFVNEASARQVRRKLRPSHTGNIDVSRYVSEDGGPKLMRSVIYARSCHGFAENETQKPVEIVQPLIEYACPPAGLVISPFAGSGTDGLIAKQTGRRAILIEAREEQCEIAANRLSQEVLFGAEVALVR